MRFLFLIAALLATLSAAAPTRTPAGRAIHGWQADSISANRYSQTAVIADRGTWLTIVQETGRRPPPPSDNGLNHFNVSRDSSYIYDLAAVTGRLTWISAIHWTSMDPAHYIALVNLTNNAAIANISTAKFLPNPSSDDCVPMLTVDQHDYVYAICGNQVWAFESTQGLQTNYFELHDTAAPVVSIESNGDGTLWVLEDYNSTKQANRLVQYDPSGQLLQAINLNFTLNRTQYLIDLAVTKNEAYMTARGVPYVLCWDIAKQARCRDLRIDGGTGRDRDFSPYFAPQISMFNQTILLVAEMELDGCEAYDLARRGFSYKLRSMQANLPGPYDLKSTGEGLIVGLQGEEHADIIAIETRGGTLIREYVRPFDNGWTTGVVIDARDNIYVSRVDYNLTSGEPILSVDVYGTRGRSHTFNVSAAGPSAFDDYLQLLWIADIDQRARYPVIKAFSPVTGAFNRSFSFTNLAQNHDLTDIKVMPLNVTRDPTQSYIIACDASSQMLAVQSEKGHALGTLPTTPYTPTSFELDYKTGLTYVVLREPRNRTTGSETYVGVYHGNGQLIQLLTAPAGWPFARLNAVAFDARNIYATSGGYDAILEWPRTSTPNMTASTGEARWFERGFVARNDLHPKIAEIVRAAGRVHVASE